MDEKFRIYDELEKGDLHQKLNTAIWEASEQYKPEIAEAYTSYVLGRPSALMDLAEGKIKPHIQSEIIKWIDRGLRFYHNYLFKLDKDEQKRVIDTYKEVGDKGQIIEDILDNFAKWEEVAND